MSQSRRASILEVCLNTASGFIVSLIVWRFVCKWYDIPMPIGRNLAITGIFTVVSILRSYLWRRLMNWLGRFFGWMNASD